MLKNRIVSLLLIFTAFTAVGQYRSENLRKADVLINNHKTYEAVEYYLKAHEEAPYMQEIVYKIASIYKNNLALAEAEKWYKKVLTYNQQEYPMARYEYASVLKNLGKYELAVKEFERFIKLYRQDDKSDISTLVKNQITGCERAEMAEQDDSYEVINLKKANSIYTDLAPFVHEDKLYYSSIKTDTPLVYLDDLGIKVQMNLYQADIDHLEDTITSAIKPFGPKRDGNDKAHYSSAVISKDGQRIFFTKCETDNDFVNHCDIYGSKKEGKTWSEPVKLGPSVNDETGNSSSNHPYLAPHRKKNKETLYFSSNKIGGQGGYDIWSVEVDDKFTCGKAKNLGRKINTSGNEITPSYSDEKNTLYFSSDGHVGFGGFDVFRVKKEGRRFKKPSPLEGPFNTSYDEFYFQHIGENKYLLVSNREGSKNYYKNFGLDDIFVIRKPINRKYLIAKVFASDKGVVELQNANIDLVSVDSVQKITSGEVVRVFEEKSYTLNTKVEQFLNDSKTVLIRAGTPDTITLNFVVKKPSQDEEIQLSNIYFEYSKAVLKDSSKLELNKLYDIMIFNPQFKIEIGAHTDSKGADRFNLRLSQKRAQAVVDYLLSKGIKDNRLVAKGYGETKPIASNTLPDGKDNPEGRALNRRIAFKVVGLISMESDSTSNDSTQNSGKPVKYKLSADYIKYRDSLELAKVKAEIVAHFPASDSLEILVDSAKIMSPVALDTIAKDSIVNPIINNDATDQIDDKKNTFVSEPINATVVRNKVRWMKKAGAQRITSKTSFSLKSLRVMAKEKTGVSFSVRVVKAKNGKFVAETEEFVLSPNKNTSARKMKLFNVEFNLELEEGSYFIFPVVTKGSLAFIPRHTYENVFNDGNFIIHKAMYNNFSTGTPTKYKFKTKEEKKNTFVNYGPFLKIETVINTGSEK